MDPRIYADGPMGLRDALLEIPLDRRLTYDADHNGLFIKVYAIVNYDNFEIAPEVEDEYVQMVRGWPTRTTGTSRATPLRASCV